MHPMLPSAPESAPADLQIRFLPMVRAASKRKFRVSVTAATVGFVGLACFFYLEDIGFGSYCSSIVKRTHCSGEDQLTNSSDEVVKGKVTGISHGNQSVVGCNVAEGKWVFNRSIEPLYSERSCPYLDRTVTCEKNGRPDSDFKYWQWHPDYCDLPKFDADALLERLKGKKVMFVGDSLQKGMWLSLVCLVESRIPEGDKSFDRSDGGLSIFAAKKLNITIEFFWAPYLVESNTDHPIIPDHSKRIISVDSIYEHARHWTNADFLIFNTYVWWMSGSSIKSLWGSFKNGLEGYEELDVNLAYRIALKTWANWVDSTINPNRTRVYFMTMSSTHLSSEDWNNPDGIKCYNETRPVERKGYWGSGADHRIMAVVDAVVKRMKVPVTFINITQLSEYRKDGHASVYTKFNGKMITAEEREEPRKYADCIHWCLPGVPDTWNQLLYIYL